MPVTSLTVDGSTTLYHVARDQYSDTLQFISILQNNMLGTPFLTQPTMIALEQSPTNTGGTPNQPAKTGKRTTDIIHVYPWSETTTIVEDGFYTLQYSTGNIISATTGLGNKAGVTAPPINILEVSFPLTISNVTPVTCVATWTQPEIGGSLMFRLEYQNVSVGIWSTVVITDATTYNVGGLTPNTIYNFRVVPFNSLGDSVLVPEVATIQTPAAVVFP